MMPSFIIKKWGEMMKTQTLTEEGLSIYDQEIKDYIKNHSSGVTMDELNSILEENTTEINNEVNNADSSVITNDDIDSIFA